MKMEDAEWRGEENKEEGEKGEREKDLGQDGP